MNGVGSYQADNILLATELIKGYGHKNWSPRCMIKIYLKKAYDSSEWRFLASVLDAMGFPSVFIRWVMACVSSVSFSILVNGVPSKPFAAKKGLRQGSKIDV